MEIHVNNVNEALPKALMYFRHRNRINALRKISTRGADRWVYPEPWTTYYSRPKERVLFNTVRDANPFFHLMDALWMIAGRRDVAWLAQFLPRIADYSDDGTNFHGAYGERMFRHWQLDEAIVRLKQDPHNSRTVISFYEPTSDTTYRGKDMPCNTTAYLGMHDHCLELTVCNRSNDLILGAYGANVVQFSMLQEYIAAHLACEVGRYVQFSNNTHLYPDHDVSMRCLKEIGDTYYHDPYWTKEVEPSPLINFVQEWDKELIIFMSNNWNNDVYKEPFFSGVARPLRRAHLAHKRGHHEEAAVHAAACVATDWRKAAVEWLERHEKVTA